MSLKKFKKKRHELSALYLMNSNRRRCEIVGLCESKLKKMSSLRKRCQKKTSRTFFLPGNRTGNRMVDGRFLKETAFGSQFPKK